MDRLHARYPFLRAAREAVDRADVDLAAVVEREASPIVERALDRVETAIGEGGVGEGHRDTRTELLSYPVARVIVSLVDDRDLTRAYAAAEAASAYDRFVADVDSPSPDSVSAGEIDLDELLGEFGLSGAVSLGEQPRIDVGPYLRLTSDLDGREWRLARRELASGSVPVDREELYALLREAVRERVVEGLPLAVPDPLAEALDPEVERIERALADTTPPEGVDAVVPDLFPPCMTALVERARSGADLEAHSAFSLAAFLSGIGMDAETAAEFCDRDPEELRRRTSRIATESGADYPAPSCATMQAYGDCVNKDDLCERIDHPTAYYATRLDEADDPTDWREAD